MAPGSGPVKIAAALTIAAAGFGGGFAYKKFRRYLDEKKLRKEREASPKRQGSAAKQPKAKSAARKRSTTQKRPRTRKKSATQVETKSRKGISEIEGKAARAAAKE
jgi:transposase